MAIQITEVRNPKFVDADGNVIDVEINHPMFGWIPYSIDPADTDLTINNAELMVLINDLGPIAPYVGPTDEELYIEAVNNVRSERDLRLEDEVDPIVTNPLRWAELSAEQQQSYVDYRRALLDIPQQDGFPYGVIWPEKP